MIRIAKSLELPDDVATQSIAILARRGAGKTYTASVIVEEVIRAKVPVVVLDPTGAWWGLRTSADGQKPGLPVVIFGGDHGDVPLEPAAGKVIADVIIEHPGAYVVDLSSFESKAAEVRFAAEFLERLYRAKKRETGPLLLVVDEADVFAPQRPGPEQTRTLGATEAIVRRGRIKGLGDLLITQRAAVLNKNVLTQTEVLIVMQTTGPQDRAAIDEWIAGNGTREQRDEVLGSLAGLERGEAWVWSPQFLRILRRVRIRARTTFDSSRTPEVGEALIAPRAFAQVDLDRLGARIRATVERRRRTTRPSCGGRSRR
jgi:DNA helicase HerA-like ATPase